MKVYLKLLKEDRDFLIGAISPIITICNFVVKRERERVRSDK